MLLNVCRNDWRDRRRHPTVPAEAVGELAQDDGATRACELAERRATLAPALAALPQLHREVLVMRFFLDLSVSETAAALRVPEGTVKSATHRALARLREELGEPTPEVHHAG